MEGWGGHTSPQFLDLGNEYLIPPPLFFHMFDQILLFHNAKT